MDAEDRFHWQQKHETLSFISAPTNQGSFLLGGSLKTYGISKPKRVKKVKVRKSDITVDEQESSSVRTIDQIENTSNNSKQSVIGAMSSSSVMSAGQMFMNFERMNNQNRFASGLILNQYDFFGKLAIKKQG